MTDAEKIERLATEVMGWTFHNGPHPVWSSKTSNCIQLGPEGWWNPLTDWNHWRAVELKVMEDDALWNWFMTDFCDEVTTYVQATLPHRVDALLSALNSLSS